MIRADSRAIVAVKVFIEQNVVLEMWIVLEFWRSAEDGPVPVAITAKTNARNASTIEVRRFRSEIHT